MIKNSFFIILFILHVTVTWAGAQEAVMVMNSPDLGVHNRPLVTFAHEQHAETVDCRRCHHDYDDYGTNIADGEGQSCTACHSKTPGKNPVSLVKAFHLQCKGCHQTLSAPAPKAVMCGQCHKR